MCTQVGRGFCVCGGQIPSYPTADFPRGRVDAWPPLRTVKHSGNTVRRHRGQLRILRCAARILKARGLHKMTTATAPPGCRPAPVADLGGALFGQEGLQMGSDKLSSAKGHQGQLCHGGLRGPQPKRHGQRRASTHRPAGLQHCSTRVFFLFFALFPPSTAVSTYVYLRPALPLRAVRDAARLRPAGPTGVCEELVQGWGWSGSTWLSVQRQLGEGGYKRPLRAATATRPLHRSTQAAPGRSAAGVAKVRPGATSFASYLEPKHEAAPPAAVDELGVSKLIAFGCAKQLCAQQRLAGCRCRPPRCAGRREWARQHRVQCRRPQPSYPSCVYGMLASLCTCGTPARHSNCTQNRDDEHLQEQIVAVRTYIVDRRSDILRGACIRTQTGWCAYRSSGKNTSSCHRAHIAHELVAHKLYVWSVTPNRNTCTSCGLA